MSNHDRYIRTTDFPAFYRLFRMRWNRWRHVRVYRRVPHLVVAGNKVMAHPVIAAHIRRIYEDEGFTPNRKARRASKASGKQLPSGYLSGLPVVVVPNLVKYEWSWAPRFKLWRFHL